MYIDGSPVENQASNGCDTLLVISTRDFSTLEEPLNNVREILLKQGFVTKIKKKIKDKLLRYNFLREWRYVSLK